MKDASHTWIALVDCNNFFVSCERLFRPDLKRKPVVVLSSNDGCVVARSQEVKRLGIPMGIPYFQCKDTLKQHDVTVFSSNFRLYRDLSRRVMSMVAAHSEKVQIYSVDEAFLLLRGPLGEAREKARILKEDIERATGIPVSVGVAKTKTLAKLANDRAKANTETKGVLVIDEMNREEVLAAARISDIWGIGAKTALKLVRANLVSALDLALADPQWIRDALGLHTARTRLELLGTACLTLSDAVSDKKGILSSRSFGDASEDFEEVLKAVSLHVHKTAEKMRKQGHAAAYIRVFLSTSRHQKQTRSVSGFRKLLSPSDDTFELLGHAEDILRDIFLPGFRYAKAGAFLSDFSPAESVAPASLFEELASAKHREIMELLDDLSNKLGPNALYPAAIGTKRSTESRASRRSPDYTASWKDIPTVQAQ